MYRFTIVVTLCLALMACASELPKETLANLYEVEAAARQLKPQSDSALLYLLSTKNEKQGYGTELRINGDLAMRSSFYDGQFYVFCLPSGKYDVLYKGDGLIPNKQEFLQAETGKIYVRDFAQYSGVLLMVIPLTASNLTEVALDDARRLISSKRIGTEPEYANARYRCRDLQR